MSSIIPIVGSLFISGLVVLFLIVGNLRAIAKAFEKSEKPGWRCFLSVWGTSAWKLALLFGLAAGFMVVVSGSLGSSDLLAGVGLSVLWAAFMGAVIGFFPAVAAGIGGNYSEAISKKAMVWTLILEVVLAVVVPNF